MENLTDYEKGVRDTMWRVSGALECADNGNIVTTDVNMFLRPVEKCNKKLSAIWISLKSQINEITKSEDY